MDHELEDDEADLTVVDIWQLCQDRPRDGLKFLAELPEHLQSTRDMMFGRFLALRQLALERVLKLGISTVRDKDEAELSRYFDGEHLEFAADALRALAFIQKDDPLRFDDWGIPEEVMLSHLDSVCVPLERLAPGSVQSILGWTKLAFIGVDRIGLLPGLEGKIPDPLMTRALEVRFTAPAIARSAVAIGSGAEPDGRSYVHFFLMERDFNRCPTFGDAGMFGDVRLFDDGAHEFSEAQEDPCDGPETGRANDDDSRIGMPPAGTQGDRDGDDDPVRELLALSDSDPAEALDWISRLSPDLLARPVILFSRFNALRHLAANRLAAAGITSVSPAMADIVRGYFGEEEEGYARSALSTIRELEAIDPDYVASRDFVQAMVEQLASVLELYAPGWSQRTLGWTTMNCFASGVRIHDVVKRSMPEDLVRSAMKRRFRIDDIVTSALGAGGGHDRERGRFVDFMLLFRDPQGEERVGDVTAGTLRYFENDEAEYTQGQ